MKLGLLFPMSGSLADKGKDCLSGAMLGIEEVNAAGGIRSLGGAKLEAILADSKGDPDTGKLETSRLAWDGGLVAVIGAYQSGVTKIATEEAERRKLPFIVCIGIADVITERGFRYTFRIAPKISSYAEAEVAFLANLGASAGFKVKRVALIHENSDYGTNGALVQRRCLLERGMEVVAEESYSAEKAGDLGREVGRILAAKPDAILETTYTRDSILIRRELAKAGSTIPLIDLAGGTSSPEYRQELGGLAEGSLSVSEYSKYHRGTSELHRRFRERYGTDLTGDSAYSYQSILVLKDALERAGSNERSRLRDALASTDMEEGPSMVLPSERLRFDKDGQNESPSLFIVQLQGGEWLPVWPAEYAVAPVRLGRQGR